MMIAPAPPCGPRTDQARREERAGRQRLRRAMNARTKGGDESEPLHWRACIRGLRDRRAGRKLRQPGRGRGQDLHDLSLQQLHRQRLAPADGARRRGLGEQGAAGRPRRPQDRERREHRPGADQLAQQHHPRQARRDPDRRRFGRGAEPDDQEGLRRRHRRHQLRPGGDRALRLCAGVRLEPHPGGAGRMDGEQLGGKGKVFVDRGLAGAPISAQLENGYLEVLKKYPGHRGRSATTTANMRSGRSRPASPACSPPIPRSTASSPRATAPARSRRCRTPAGRSFRSPPSPTTSPRPPARRPRAPSASSAPTRPSCRPRRSGWRSTSSTASRSRPTATSWSTATSWRPMAATGSPSSIPTPRSRRSRSARMPCRIARRD